MEELEEVMGGCWVKHTGDAGLLYEGELVFIIAQTHKKK